MKDDIRVMLAGSASKVSLTFDLWTSPNNLPFLVITGHWFTESYKLIDFVLDFVNLPYPHRGVDISQALGYFVGDFGLERKVMGITVDNAGNMETAYQELLQDFPHLLQVCCAAHCLNICCQAGFNYLKSSISKLRELLKSINQPKAYQVKYIPKTKLLPVWCISVQSIILFRASTIFKHNWIHI